MGEHVAAGTRVPGLVDRVAAVCRAHAAELIGLQDVQRLLQGMQQQVPDVVAEVQRSVPPQRVAETLRRLLQEGIPTTSRGAPCATHQA